ncbi:flagellar basal body-associated FliL family protein [Teredinibacter waterburyi]|uniref:flagellar basal body-associated FliL family protein n=1 Tax=Teredinibacter waterburyi TaxID=1500538 RepID=UPI001FE588EA|nr:flagellar basal body-associated FliL family protein [Teredinibacter waterburyi]
MNRFSVLRLLCMLVGLQFALANVAWAEDDVESADAAGEAESPEGAAEGQTAAAIYLPLKPAFIVNYGGVGKLKYLKADVSVRLASSDAANSVRHHLPYIRNNLVMLFSSQTSESLDSQAGREALRSDALAEISKILLEEDNQDGVIEVFFDTFILQK